jgi:hypothetical protein
LGVRISRSTLGRFYGHGGSIPGFRSQLAYYPERCIAVAVQVSTSTGPADRNLSAYLDELAAAVLEAAPRPPGPRRPGSGQCVSLPRR